jgi:phosphoglycolate phosphatase
MMDAAPQAMDGMVRGGFRPEAQDVYLFDIDGTLLRSRDRVHYNSFARAVAEVLGAEISLDGVQLHGNVDPAILRAALGAAGVREELWSEQREHILEAMSRDVLAQRAGMTVEVMPGVREVLQALHNRGALLGLATGNLEQIGWLKVELAGLREWFAFGGFSDGCEDRPGMIAEAVRKAHNAWEGRGGAPGLPLRMCVVGDTPADIAAARANGLPTLAVATGHFTVDELMAHEPEGCVETLEALLPLLGDGAR